MHKKWKGFFTVEASFIMPIILFLYLLIILTALFLYCRCAISQDDFLLGMRAGRFTWGEDNYGEVIYGADKKDSWQAENYVEERLIRKRAFYPFFPTETGECKADEKNILVQTRQKGSKTSIIKIIQNINPVMMVREGRKI